jgi:hypothetical protein
MPEYFVVDAISWIQTKCIRKKSSPSVLRSPQTPGLLKQPLLARSQLRRAVGALGRLDGDTGTSTSQEFLSPAFRGKM